jgi:hypothetical protein
MQTAGPVQPTLKDFINGRVKGFDEDPDLGSQGTQQDGWEAQCRPRGSWENSDDLRTGRIDIGAGWKNGRNERGNTGVG